MKNFSIATEKGADLLKNLIDDHKEGIEEGYGNSGDEKTFRVDLALKFKPKDGGHVKVEADISFTKEKVKDFTDVTVSDQGALFDDSGGQFVEEVTNVIAEADMVDAEQMEELKEE